MGIQSSQWSWYSAIGSSMHLKDPQAIEVVLNIMDALEKNGSVVFTKHNNSYCLMRDTKVVVCQQQADGTAIVDKGVVKMIDDGLVSTQPKETKPIIEFEFNETIRNMWVFVSTFMSVALLGALLITFINLVFALAVGGIIASSAGGFLAGVLMYFTNSKGALLIINIILMLIIGVIALVSSVQEID